MTRKRRGRREGSVFQRESDGLWIGSISLGYDANGKRLRRVVSASSKSEALEKMRALVASGAGPIGDADKLSLSEYLDRWLDQTKDKLAPTTHHRYEQHVRLHLKPHVGCVLLRKIEPFHVEQLYREMEKAGDSASERQKTGKALSTALRAAVRSRLIPYNPCLDVVKPRVTKEEIHPLDGSQAKALLTAARGDRLHALYVLALDSGMRQGELFGLHWPDIDFSAGCVQVRRSLEEIAGHHRIKELKTKSSRRRIELSPFALDALHEHRKVMLAEGRDVKDGAVFVDAASGFLRKSNFARRSFKPALVRAALPTSTRFHDLRHTCATLLLMADVNVKVVSERLGHAKIQITLDTYSHVLPTMQKKAAEKLGALWAAEA
jgi:integrase